MKILKILLIAQLIVGVCTFAALLLLLYKQENLHIVIFVSCAGIYAVILYIYNRKVKRYRDRLYNEYKQSRIISGKSEGHWGDYQL